MRILITAGGTREYIDPVRFISNASSGRMGYELARAAIRAQHKVTLITTIEHKLPVLKQSKVVKVNTAAEMFEEVKKHFSKCNCLIMAAAVADYTPAKISKTKIKKQKSDLVIKLKPTADILKWAGKNKLTGRKKKIIVGFALEDKDILQNAQKKLKNKNLDMIIANSPSVIGNEKSTIHIKTSDTSWQTIENKSKKAIAQKLIKLIEEV